MSYLANFHQSTWKSQNRDSDGILLSKLENARAKNLQRIYMYGRWRMTKDFKRNWLVVSKLAWGIWRILTRALVSLKNLYFMVSFGSTYIMFERKKYWAVYFQDSEEWCKIWRNIELSFRKWHEEFDKFSQFGSLKIGTLMGSFCPK